MPTWKQRQAAQRRFDQDQAFQQRVGDLVGLPGLTDPEIPDHDVVGWFQRTPGTIRGKGHLCLACSPGRPLGCEAVTRNLLAATMPCSRCGLVLEQHGKQK